MKRVGHPRALSLVGGLHGWQALGYPLEGEHPEIQLHAV